MVPGGIQADDLVTIIGEQTISIRVLEQEKRNLVAECFALNEKVNSLEAKLELHQPNGM